MSRHQFLDLRLKETLPMNKKKSSGKTFHSCVIVTVEAIKKQFYERQRRGSFVVDNEIEEGKQIGEASICSLSLQEDMQGHKNY